MTTVAELISILSRMPRDLVVVTEAFDSWDSDNDAEFRTLEPRADIREVFATREAGAFRDRNPRDYVNPDIKVVVLSQVCTT